MRVRFGYVALSMELKDASPNKTVTVQNLMRLEEDVRLLKLRQLTRQNLHNQLRLLKHNLSLDILVYRLTSRLVPLATHESTAHWDYASEFADAFRTIGDFVNQHGMRVSFHPDHFVNINSPKQTILRDSIHILRHHHIQTQAMGLDEQVKFNIHVGGAYADKQAALERFIEQWALVPADIQQHITLENDDKTFTAKDVLYCCQKLCLPMVLDIHHHHCHHEADSRPEDWFAGVVKSWEGTGLPPKVHVSSPRGTANAAEFRSHAKYVAVDDLIPFLKLAKEFTPQIDVMLEAKNKDLALMQLMADLKHHEEVGILDGATIEI